LCHDVDIIPYLDHSINCIISAPFHRLWIHAGRLRESSLLVTGICPT
jgi:hypothetical protein